MIKLHVLLTLFFVILCSPLFSKELKGELKCTIIDPKEKELRCANELCFYDIVTCLKPELCNDSKKSEDSNTVKLITLRNNLKKGELIYEKDLIFDFKSKSVGNGYFIDKNVLIGREVNQNLSRGQIIRVRHLKERFTVIEGQAIIIYAELNGINVKMEGNALQNGHLNEMIKVKNNSSGKVVEGKIINEKKILINY